MHVRKFAYISRVKVKSASLFNRYFFLIQDDIDISTAKNFESSKINQSHGFTFGEGNNQNATYTKSACQTSNSSSTILSEDDGKSKLTPTSYQVKIRRRRACQMKALIVILAIMAAACIGCIIGYFFIEYSKANQRHFELVKNMVSSRKCQFYLREFYFIFTLNISNLTFVLKQKSS